MSSSCVPPEQPRPGSRTALHHDPSPTDGERTKTPAKVAEITARRNGTRRWVGPVASLLAISFGVATIARSPFAAPTDPAPAGSTSVAPSATPSSPGATGATGAAAPHKPGTLAEAKVHMDKGQDFFLAKKYAEAAVEFHTAFEIKGLSTFLFNEAVCYEKLKSYDTAIKLFQRYMESDPTAPDRPGVEKRIARIKSERDGGTAGDAGVGPTPSPTAPAEEMRSIVVIESVPEGAPVEIWSKTDPKAIPFKMDGPNVGWTKIVSGTTLLAQSLPLGTYHVVMPKFLDYRPTETDITVAAATISQFKANLAQGAFFGVLKIRAFDEEGELRGAKVSIKKDDAAAKFEDRGLTPYDESLESGPYMVRVEYPGFKPLDKKIIVEHGKIDQQKIEMLRSDDGLLRFDITGTDKADVFVGDKLVGIWEYGKDKVEAPVKAGLNRIRVKGDDRKTYKVDIDVPKGRMIVVHVELKPSVPRGAAWSSGITAAIFLGGGIYFGIESNRLKSELTAARDANKLDQADSRIKKGQYYAIGADAAFGVATIFGLISLYSALKDPLPDSRGFNDTARDFDAPTLKPRITSFAPAVTPTFAGLAFTGEF